MGMISESLKLKLELMKINTTSTLLTYGSLFAESASDWLHCIAQSAEMSLWSREISAEGLALRIMEMVKEEGNSGP
jgi:hypothetical protein